MKSQINYNPNLSKIRIKTFLYLRQQSMALYNKQKYFIRI